MYADLDEMNRIRGRVERRVRGEILFRLHRAFAFFCLGLTMLALLIDANRHHHGGTFLLILLFFGGTLGTHTLFRHLNRTADQIRDTEMQRELERAGYYGEIEKRKRAESYAHLSDDGELVYDGDDGNTQARVSTN